MNDPKKKSCLPLILEVLIFATIVIMTIGLKSHGAWVAATNKQCIMCC